MSGAGVSQPLEIAITRKCYRRPDGAEVEAVRDLAFTLEPGSFTCMIGPSGCGKTTTLRILLGLDRDFEGHIRPSPDALTIGIAFQEPRLLPWRSVEQNVRLALPAGSREKSLDSLFEALGLTEWRGHYPGELSLGLARRASLARALAVEPELLVLDEPFVSLDDHAAAELRSVLVASIAPSGVTVLMVTHNLREALELADRLIFLTPRPARVLGETRFGEAREQRTGAWIESWRGKLATQFPSVVAQ
jgi:NitT/TauT family transport system ATP-binding protein